MVDTYKESNGRGGQSVFRSLIMGPNVEAANGVALRAESGSTESRRDALLTYKRRRNNNVAESEKTTQDSASQASEKESAHSCEDWSKCTSQTGTLRGLPNGMSSNGCVKESKDCRVTELCERTFTDIIMSDKFAQLCNLLIENFEGVRADKLFDLNHINSKMKESAYESSPLLFQSDMQEIWTKLQKVGSGITALAKCLSEKTAAFHEQVGNSARGIPKDSKYEFPMQEPVVHAKVEQTETHPLHEAHTCRRCQQKSDGKNVLICDSCEGMYHISCIEPPVKEIPTRSWYCFECTAKEIESSHENCVACERLSTSCRDEIEHGETTDELDESSNGFFFEEEINKRYTHCKVCRNEVCIGVDDYRICGHHFCPHNFYHTNCLTSKQLTSHGPCWYCPSCLCRGCLTDRDDDKIVLCDGCDHAYHLYCMHPPRSDIPKGKWFCGNCKNGIDRIREAKRTYEVLKNASRKRGLDGKLKDKEVLNKSGGVDMLLNAAKTLNYEENLASMGLKTD